MAHPLTDTDDELQFRFQIEAGEARRHARCGPKSGCRTRALSEVDYVLDIWLTRHPVTVAVPNVPTVVAGPITG